MTAAPHQADHSGWRYRSGRVWLTGLILAAAAALTLPTAAQAAENAPVVTDDVATTSNYVPTTTIGDPSLDATAFSPECIGATPYIKYAIKPIGFSSSGPATLSFYSTGGTFIETRVVPTLSGSTIYPGASANPLDWPGWRLAENGNWEPDPSDAGYRNGLTVEVSVTAPSGVIEATTSVSYPSTSSACYGPPERSLDVSAFAPICISDAPYISYDIRTIGFETTGPATLTFFDLNGNFVEEMVVPTLQGRVIYPGASVDAGGHGTDWPGWKQAPNGAWIPDSSDAFLRAGLTIEVEVNPTATAAVTYPPLGSPCADPPEGTPPTTTICVGTSSTGGNDATTTGGDPACDPCVPGSTTGSSSSTTGGTPGCSPCVPGQTTGDAAAPSSTVDPRCALPRTGSNGTRAIMALGALALAAGVGIAFFARRRNDATPA